MSVDVLAIAAHPDDVEQTCGGTLIKMTEMGYRTGVLDLTAAERAGLVDAGGRFQAATLNPFLAGGRPLWTDVRTQVVRLVESGPPLRQLQRRPSS